ncbi:DUF3558 family protein [Amycolatopsis lurida]
MKRSPSVIAVRVGAVLLVGLFAVSCTGKEGGRAEPSPAGQSHPDSSSAPPSSSDSRGIFGDAKACEVLDPASAEQGFPAGEFSDIGGENGCRASKFGASVSLFLSDIQSIDELKGSPEKRFDGKVNGRRALRVEDVMGDGGACQIGVEVAAKARAVVTVTLGSNRPTAEACDLGLSIATAVEPRLPKG